MAREAKVINLFGGPSSGKSTTAAGLFHLMKVRGLSVELVTEYARDLIYEGQEQLLGNQLTVLGEQFNRLYRLRDKVDYIITDSPLMLGYIYAKDIFQAPWFCLTVLQAFEYFDNYNIILSRTEPYKQEGRLQTEAEAIKIDEHIRMLLDTNNIKYYTCPGDERAPKLIADNLIGTAGLPSLAEIVSEVHNPFSTGV